MDRKNLEEFAKEHATETRKTVIKYRNSGWGKRRLMTARNSPEDMEISMDKACEKVFLDLMRSHDCNWYVVSEYETFGEMGNPELIALDPFDGSDQFERDFQDELFTAWTLYEKDNKGYIPSFTAIFDIERNRLFVTRDDGNYRINLNTNSETKISPSSKKELKKGLCIASYVRDASYRREFYNLFGDLIDNQAVEAYLYPNGGSYIYAYLANGLIDAYLMLNEPRREIDPGYFIAQKAGCPIISVNQDSFENYTFDIEKRLTRERSRVFIATSTPELRDAFLGYIKTRKI